jgi:murein DD-endopeptidase MepM/ murein hydrolase activator NlpD
LTTNTNTKNNLSNSVFAPYIQQQQKKVPDLTNSLLNPFIKNTLTNTDKGKAVNSVFSKYVNNTHPSGYGIGTGDTDLSLVKGEDGIDTMIQKMTAIYSADINSKLTGKSYEESLSSYVQKNYTQPNNPTDDSSALIDNTNPIEMADKVSGGGTSIGSMSNLNFKTTESRADEKSVPKGYGKIHTYMGWGCLSAPKPNGWVSNQWKLKSAVENYDSNGMGLVGDRWAVAVKPYYGSVGDYLNIIQEDGSTYKVAIADIKGSENASEGAISNYVHGDKSLVEFVVNKNTWYSKSKGGNASRMHANVGQEGFLPELYKNISRIINVGNFWDYDYKVASGQASPSNTTKTTTTNTNREKSNVKNQVASSKAPYATVTAPTVPSPGLSNGLVWTSQAQLYNLNGLVNNAVVQKNTGGSSSTPTIVKPSTKNKNNAMAYGPMRRAISSIGYGGVSAQDVIQVASNEVGVVETYNNNVKYNTEYYGRVVSGDNYAWCCVFIWWVFKHAGASSLFNGGSKTAYCPTLQTYFKNQGRYFNTGQPGDIVFFDFGKGRASHVGIVVSRIGDNQYLTIEGNTSATNQANGGCVQKKVRNTSNIIGFGRPAYTSYGLSSTNDTKSTTTTQAQVQTPVYDNPLSELFGKMSDAYNKSYKKALGNGSGSLSRNTGVTSWLENSLHGTISSGYGHRSTALGNEYHHGIDISASLGQDILSPIDGIVVGNGTDAAGYGNYTVIRDNNGNNHLFAHMNKPAGYGVGSKISQSDVIGEVGSSGKSTGSHLHYEIRKNGSKYSSIDPSTYNINKTNTKLSDNSVSVGTGNTDLSSTAIRDKLNIALNADGIETKLDTLIDVMKTWAERDIEHSKKLSQSVTNTTNNTTISYGNGKKKQTSSSKSSTSSATIDTRLAAIHQAIAAN